jgi:hypothetical protein
VTGEQSSIFISYSQEDKELARALARALDNLGLRVSASTRRPRFESRRVERVEQLDRVFASVVNALVKSPLVGLRNLVLLFRLLLGLVVILGRPSLRVFVVVAGRLVRDGGSFASM